MVLSVTPFCKNLKIYMYKFAKEKSRKCILKCQYIFLGNGISGDFGVFVCFVAYDLFFL